MDDKTIRAHLDSSEFDAFFYGNTDSPAQFAVAFLDAENRALFGCDGNTLWLSRHSLDEHKERHPEVGIDDYRSIPDIIQRAQVWHGCGTKRYLLLWIGNKPYRAALKTDSHGVGAWFLSLVISGKQKPPKGAVRLK
jgi:hypothetical protein